MSEIASFVALAVDFYITSGGVSEMAAGGRNKLRRYHAPDPGFPGQTLGTYRMPTLGIDVRHLPLKHMS